MNTVKELLEDLLGYYERKNMVGELKADNMLFLQFQDPHLENVEGVNLLIIVDAPTFECRMFCFSLYSISEERKDAAIAFLNTVNDAERVFSRYSLDEDNEIKVSLCAKLLPNYEASSFLLTGIIARMAKDIDSVYPILKENLL